MGQFKRILTALLALSLFSGICQFAYAKEGDTGETTESVMEEFVDESENAEENEEDRKAEEYDEAVDITLYEASVIASESQDGNPAVQAIDGSVKTKWAAEGPGQWLRIRLDRETEITSVGISFTSGDVRLYQFELQTSLDAENWTTVYSGTNSGTTADIEIFDLVPTRANYFRFLGGGSNVNMWNNINEITGLKPKEITYRLNIDGIKTGYKHETTADNGTYFIPLLEATADMEKTLTCTWDEVLQKAVIKTETQTMTVDFKNKSAVIDGRNIPDGSLVKLADDGEPLIPYTFLGELDAATAKYSGEDKTVYVTTDYYDRILAAYAKIDNEFLSAMDWLVGLYDPETGGFYNTTSGAKHEGYYPSIEATGFFCAMCSKTESGAIAAMPDEFRQKLINFFQSRQDPETGWFIEEYPKAPSYNDRDKMRVHEQAVDKLKQLGSKPLYPLPEERISAVTIGETVKSSKANIILTEPEPTAAPIKKEKVSELAVKNETEKTKQSSSSDFTNNTDVSLPSGVPEYCITVNSFIENMASRNWDSDSWTAGDKAYEDMSYVEMLPESVRQYYIDAALEWLDERQDPETGYWSANGSINFNDVSGAFKVCRIYNRYGLCPPRPMTIAETVLKTLRQGYNANAACYVRNPISIFEILVKYDAEVKAMIRENECEIVELYSKYIHDMFTKDGAAATKAMNAVGKFGGLLTGGTGAEGDMDGMQQMWLARSYLAQVFGRTLSNDFLAEYYDEFWNKLLTKEPIVKEEYDAKPGVVFEEDFDEINEISELTDNSWGFMSFNNYIKSRGANNNYLLVDDRIIADVEGCCGYFPRVSSGTVECEIMFNRKDKYTAKNDDCCYTYFRLYADSGNAIELHAVDSGSDRMELAVAYMVGETKAYKKFTTITRGEWVKLKIDFTFNDDGTAKVQYYVNGKPYKIVNDMLTRTMYSYITGVGLYSSALRVSQLAIDNIKVTSR